MVLAELRTLAPAEDRWMGAKDAADYLGLTLHALHKYTAAKTIPFTQHEDRGKLWFRKAELDAWRMGG